MNHTLSVGSVLHAEYEINNLSTLWHHFDKDVLALKENNYCLFHLRCHLACKHLHMYILVKLFYGIVKEIVS
jgi:hypothetical protein